MAFDMPGQSAGPPGAGGAGTGQRVAERPSRGRVLVPTILVVSALVLAFVVFASIYSDWLWFGSVDKTSVYATTLMTQVGLFLVFGAATGGVLALNAAIAFRTRPAFGRLTAEQASLERYRGSIEPYRVWLSIGISTFLGIMTGLSATAEWKTFQLWREGGQFGQTDAQFGMDAGFFVFQLPWYQFLMGWVFAVLVLSLLTAAVVHYLYGGIRFQSGSRSVSPAAQTQLAILGGLLLLAKAVAYWLDRYDLATESQSLLPGFTGLRYVDVHAVLPSKTILAFASVVVAVLFFVTAFRRQWALPLIGLGLLLVSSIVIGWAYPMIVQYFQVRPSEEVRERPFIQNNIDATRQAYQLTGVEMQEYAGNEVAPASVIKNDAATLRAIRLLDPSIVSPTFRQQQQIRGFYQFPDSLDVDRYRLEPGSVQGAIVSVREVNLEGVPERNWINDHTVYTHGYGFVAAKDNTATSTGAPSYFESDIPPEGDLDIQQPRVYFGENSPEYSIVGAPAGSEPRELDFPDDKNQTTGQSNNTYDGSGGVAIGSFFNKLVYATRFQDSNILLSDVVNADSRILYDRDPRERVEKVAPWLTLDGDPYPVVVDGRIKWLLDGYTTSNSYPNAARTDLNEATSDSVTATSRSVSAQQRDQVTYIRNSVKATVDAYDGTVNLYLWDETDPVALAWERVFPGTVLPKDEMPEQVLQHIRYPEDIFKVQRTVLSRYHVTDAQSFYSGQDFWTVPNDPTKTVEVLQPPYYLTLQMPGTTEPSFSITTTFSPVRRQTLAAFMAANSTPGEDYGRIRVLQLPRNTTIPGPTQVQNNFESNPAVSSDLNLLRRGGSDVVLGNLLSLPVADGMLYVEPVYVRAIGEQGFPLLRMVLVGYGSQVAMEPTLREALEKVFVGSAGTGGGGDDNGDEQTPSEALSQALSDAAAAYEEGQRALAAGDFTAYGEAQAKLKAALDRAAAAQAQITGQNPPAATEPSPEPDISGTSVS